MANVSSARSLFSVVTMEEKLLPAFLKAIAAARHDTIRTKHRNFKKYDGEGPARPAILRSPKIKNARKASDEAFRRLLKFSF